MKRDLKAALFNDEVPGGAPRESPVAKAGRSDRAKAKAATKLAEPTAVQAKALGLLGVTLKAIPACSQ